jgi:hypothetical protein
MTTQQLTVRNDRLWADSNIDLSADHVYKIDNTLVLSANELGLTVTKSNLREIGTLKTLEVSGTTTLAEFAHFNSSNGRLGLGTIDANASISILDNDVEIAIGSPEPGIAHFGTYSTSDVAIISDNIPRILVKSNGEVIIGSEAGKTGVLRVHGSLHVDNFVSDTRVERTSSLEFKANRDASIYGLGLLWTAERNNKELIMRSDPDRLWANTSVDLEEHNAYYINGRPVLSATNLGTSVVNSNLITVGPLQSLIVTGNTVLQGELDASSTNASLKSLLINNGVESVSLNAGGTNSNKKYKIAINEEDVFYGSNDEIIIGNPNFGRRSVKIFGPISTTSDLTVDGAVTLNNKKFTKGDQAPIQGQFNKGDIQWNENPIESGYVGWICVASGTPGQWLPFGAIARQ